jgi:hypothetical protein
VIYKLRCDIAHRGSLVITDEDYIQFVVRMSYNEFSDPIPLSLKFFPTAQRRCLSATAHSTATSGCWSRRCAGIQASVRGTYSIDYRPDPLIMDVWQSHRRYVKLIAQGVGAFVPALYVLVRSEDLAP